ncbi:hypothetical protein AB1Y20_005410 [Prymnesium parvum]|uniref:Protein xylosyltransferase n=1 Tax=Prymnesium parvum TaxID=97485 RepID=A0AB34J461_PRYPA
MSAVRCAISSGRTLHHHLPPRPRESGDACWPPVLDDAAGAITLVITWSSGSKAASRAFPSLSHLAALASAPRAIAVRALFVSKGSACARAPQPAWLASGRAYCIEGPNVGAREAHTVMQFCVDFYSRPPAAALFLQDDPDLPPIRRVGLTPEWVRSLAAGFARRAARRGDSAEAEAAPWVPEPCACTVIHEDFFDASRYGGYRPIAWWLRTFLAPYWNSYRLPHKLRWPQTAQFAIPGEAITARSLEFWRFQVSLAQVRAPLKHKLPNASASFYSARNAKWANFGPAIVDLGPVAPDSGDKRPIVNGMDLAQLLERSWFRVFDPALQERTPSYPECFSEAAIAMSPMRCDGPACPGYDAARPELTRVQHLHGDGHAAWGSRVNYLTCHPLLICQQSKAALTTTEVQRRAWADRV